MVATPQDQGIVARIQRIEQTIKNLTQKAPINVGMLQGNNFVDGSGNAIFGADAVAGWGISGPAVSVPWSATNASARGFVPWSGSDLGELTMFNSFVYIDHSVLDWSYVTYADGSTSTVSYRMTFDGVTIPGSTRTATGADFGTVVSGSLPMSESNFGQIKQLSLLQHQTAGVSGVGDAFSTPRYLILTHA